MPATRPPLLIGLASTDIEISSIVADYLCRHHDFVRLAYADALHTELAAAFGLRVDYFDDQSACQLGTDALALSRCSDADFVMPLANTENDLTRPRTPQWIKEHWRDVYRAKQSGAGYWQQQTENALADMDRAGLTRIVITDVGTDNEAKPIRERRGHIWHLGGANCAPTVHAGPRDVVLYPTTPTDALLRQVSGLMA